MKLKKRLSILEEKASPHKAFAVFTCKPGEDKEAARLKHLADHPEDVTQPY